MRVLWISNVMLPDLTSHLGERESVGGGWMVSLANELKDKITLGVFSIYKETLHHSINDIEYFTAPCVDEQSWKKILSQFNPDIIHIHGTEYPHTLQVKRLSGSIPCVASIQGLVSVYARYALGGLTKRDIIKSLTLKDIIKHSSPYDIQKGFINNGKAEIQLIKELDYIIGRTSWDYAHAKAINPQITYFKCNECIRDEFYNGNWQYSNVSAHTIFCSNANVPLKGIHQVIKAMTIVRHWYPDIKLRLAGKQILGKLTLRNKLRLSGYDNYLRRLIAQNDLTTNVEFLGRLSAHQMKEEFLKANAFILPSSIENSSNTLAEAQLLGVPIIASQVGGNKDMLPYPLDKYMYRFEEIEMLAQKIVELFDNSDWEEYNTIAKQIAAVRHDCHQISSDMLAIYNNILSR